MLSQSLAISLAGLANADFIQHVKGCSISVGQLAQSTTSHRETALIIKFSCDRRKIAIRAVQITP